MKYKQLKTITPGAIYESQDWEGGLSCFIKEFTRFVAMFNVRYENVVPLENLELELDIEPEWANWLIKHGFIEKVVEKVIYSIGDRFLNEKNQNKYLLAKTSGGRNLVALINLESGNTWLGNIQVESFAKITEMEFGQLAVGGKFSKIGGK